MKSLKLLSAGLLALGLASVCSAQTYIRITGSSAFRAPAQQAILNILTPASTAVAYDGSSYLGCSASIVRGNTAATFGALPAGSDVIIKTYWTGSAAGVLDVVEGNSLVKFIPDASLPAATVSSSVTGAYTAEAGVASACFTDVAFSEVAQSVATANAPYGATYSGDVIAAALANAGVTAGPVGQLGVVPFKWVVGKSAIATPITNITQQEAAAIVKKGYRPVSSFTGNSADASDFAFFIGRNEDSGTRITTFAESQTGFGQSCLQWQLAIDGNLTSTSLGTAVTGLRLWPGSTSVNTQPNLKWISSGHSGYNTGGNVQNVLKTNNPVTGLTPANTVTGFIPGTSKAWLITCVGISDGNAITAGGGSDVSYCGVPYSIAAVQNGSYPLWGYEHMYYLTASTIGTQVVIGGSPAADVADAIADEVYNTTVTTSSAGIKLSTMSVTRAGTGKLVN